MSPPLERNDRASASSVPDDATERRLRDAAARCVHRFGVAKTSLADIAAEAGCSRQTVYNHFPNAEAVIAAAMLEASEAFAERLLARVRSERTPGDRVVEAMMFCLEELPREPLLGLIADPALGRTVGESVFTTQIVRERLERIAGVCLEGSPELRPRTAELAEMMTRLMISLLVVQQEPKRGPKKMRAFLRRWLLPGLTAA